MEPQNWAGRTLRLEVDAVAHGGHCVARCAGRVVFVRHALPGEEVLAEVTEDTGKSFCRADVVQVLQASPDRVSPPCPMAGPGLCGGCDWQHVRQETQLELKGRVVTEQLQRLAGIEWPVRVESLPGGLLRWRTRTRFVTGDDGWAGLRVHRSHRIIPLTDCPITRENAAQAGLSQRWEPDERVEVTEDDLERVHLRVGGKHRRGGTAEQHSVGRTWRLAAHGFWQAHPAAPEAFADVVHDWAAVAPGEHAWDLYAGVGLFAGVLADQVGESGDVVAVESGHRAVADGKANLADLPQVRWRRGRVERVLPRIDERPQVVVLDPPRQGAGRAVVDQIASAGPDRVIYVSCDPAALARDVATFATHGYRLERLRAFDAFPMTHHVECIALLQ